MSGGRVIRTNRLHCKTEDIPQEKDQSELLSANDRVLISINKLDHSSEGHVYCGCEQGWCEKDVCTLDDKGHKAIVACFLRCGFGASGVASELDCMEQVRRQILELKELYARNPPTTRGIRNHVLFLNICQRWKPSVDTKRRTNTTAPAIEGSY